MALTILHNRAQHTHENEQFRRFSDKLSVTFNKNKWTGVLIGNPYNDDYSRFRADAILSYDYGLILIDFKDYKGVIHLPPNEQEFQNVKWYSETISDKSKVEVKAGSRFINPFRQLKAYRQAFYEVIGKNNILSNIIDPSRVCALNIFSGPLEIKNQIPRSLPYYKIIQESDMENFLYDFASENTHTSEIGSELITIFPAENWISRFTSQINSNPDANFSIADQNVTKKISEFLNSQSDQILVLESKDRHTRDNWMQAIYEHEETSKIPEMHLWGHSSRICRKIKDRTGFEHHSIYKMIYGGNQQSEGSVMEDLESESLMEIIPLASNSYMDPNALIIIHEAHLINRSLNQSELLRFGTGRLLEDIMTFLELENSKRKIVLIGDPYSISFGKNEDSALNIETLKEICTLSISHYRELNHLNSSVGKDALIFNIVNAIEDKTYNSLSYNWIPGKLEKIQIPAAQEILIDWFSVPLENEPLKTVLLYKKKDARKTNLWIKKHCLRNGDNLACNDILLVNNNITVPDTTGFGQPKKIVNGMYLKVLKINETFSEILEINKIRVSLTFKNLSVRLIGTTNFPEVEIWILENYFDSDSGLSKDEKIAYQVFISKRLSKEKTRHLYTESIEFRLLQQDFDFRCLSQKEKDAIKVIATNYSLIKEEKEPVNTTREARILNGRYKAKYDQRLLRVIRETDPFVNAAFVSYAWATTVHKAVGSSFDNVIINGFHGEDTGINNANYYRWLYSALSTAEKTVAIINPQEINPLANCEFEDIPEINALKEKSKRKLLIAEKPNDPKYDPYILQLQNTNVAGTVVELSKNIISGGYILEFVQMKSEYLTRVVYSVANKGEAQLILDVDSKGRKENFGVSNIRITNSKNIDTGFILKVIDKLFLTNEENLNKYPADFRQVIYAKWNDTAEFNGMQMRMIESHNNQDILEVFNLDQHIKFRVWYGTSEKEKTKGFITKIVIIEKSNEHLGQTLKSWILS